jgi:hypothetical protein
MNNNITESHSHFLSKNEQVWVNCFTSAYTRGLSKGQSLEFADEILYEFEKKFPVVDLSHLQKNEKVIAEMYNNNYNKQFDNAYAKDIVTKIHGDFL